MKRCCQYQKIEKVHKKGLTAVWLYGIISKRWKRLDVWWRLIAGVAQLAEQLICNQQVAGSSPITSSIMGEFPSGQRGQTVNLLLFSFGGPNPPSPTKQKQTIFLMVCFCLGRVDNRTIFAQQKHGSPKRRKKKLFPTVKSRASNELRQRSQFGEAQRTHPRIDMHPKS